MAIPISRAAHRALARRIWELLESRTPSEALDVSLVIAEGRLSRARLVSRGDIEALPISR